MSVIKLLLFVCIITFSAISSFPLASVLDDNHQEEQKLIIQELVNLMRAKQGNQDFRPSEDEEIQTGAVAPPEPYDDTNEPADLYSRYKKPIDDDELLSVKKADGPQFGFRPSDPRYYQHDDIEQYKDDGESIFVNYNPEETSINDQSIKKIDSIGPRIGSNEESNDNIQSDKPKPEWSVQNLKKSALDIFHGEFYGGDQKNQKTEMPTYEKVKWSQSVNPGFYHRTGGEITPEDRSKMTFIAAYTAAVVFIMIVIVAAACKYQANKKNVDYPAYGVTGPNREFAPPTADRQLAYAAQMYHYQHQKQQIIAAESKKSNGKENVTSDSESEEDEFAVYECPGLASTGEMEVKNPMFQDEDAAKTQNTEQEVKTEKDEKQSTEESKETKQ